MHKPFLCIDDSSQVGKTKVSKFIFYLSLLNIDKSQIFYQLY